MKTFIYKPVGLDRIEDRHAGRLETGQKVVLTQPYGCPRNGTMGHCYIADAATGDFIGLVLINSLEAA